MKYSIVVISKGRHEMMVEGLKQLLKIPNCPQIVVIEAIDNPPPLDLKGVDYHPIPENEGGFAHQRNLGVERANCEYVIFADDDIEIDPERWYNELTKVIDEDPTAAGVMGAVFPLRPSIIGFCEGVLGHPGGGFKLHNRSDGKIMPLDQVATCNTIMKKSIIADVGWFDLKNRFGSEDSDLTIRVTRKYGGGQFRYAPDAFVYHLPRNKFSKIIPWYIRRGKSDADLFLKHTTHLDYLLKTTILLKIIPVVILSAVLQNWAIFWGVFLLWYCMQLYRVRFVFKYFHLYDDFGPIKRITTYLVFPLVKLTADVMFDIGRLIRWLNLHEK